MSDCWLSFVCCQRSAISLLAESRLTQLALLRLLYHIMRRENHRVNHARHGERAADNGAKSGKKMIERLLLVRVLDRNRRDLITEPNGGHHALTVTIGDEIYIFFIITFLTNGNFLLK